MKIQSLYLTILLAAILVSCSSDDQPLAIPYNPETSTSPGPTPTYSSGSANFATYVAVGNSLTAGYSDNALFKKGQLVSFPKILSEQFALVGGGNFTQPLMDDDLGGMLIGGQPLLDSRLVFDLRTQTPVTLAGTPGTDVTNIVAGPYNNMGVPGAKAYHLLANGYGSLSALQAKLANPYFVRMASTPTASVLEDAMAMNPTFFSLWIGANDVLGYAASGGEGEDHNETGNLNPATYASNDITNNNVFGQVYGGILQGLTASGADGIVMNIPDVTSAPYFTTIPYAPLDPTNPDFGPQIPTLNAIFGALNQIYTALQMPERMVVFNTNAASAVLIKDEKLVDISAQITGALNASPTFPLFVQQFGLPEEAAPLVANLLGTAYGQTRQATADDLIVLPARQVIGQVNTDFVGVLMQQGLPQTLAGQFSVQGVTYALEDKWVLTPEEQGAVANAIMSYNQTIEAMATQFDLAFFDVNAFFDTVASGGVQAGSATITTDYVTGGAFSLDGIHPSPRGYAVIANNIIGVINTKYGATLPTVNPVEYTGLYVD